MFTCWTQDRESHSRRLVEIRIVEAKTDLLFIISCSFFCRPPGLIRKLPLGLLRGQKVVQCLDNVLEAGQPSTELLLDASLVVTELGVEVLSVRGGAHGSAEDRLDEEAVVLAEGVAVCGTE